MKQNRYDTYTKRLKRFQVIDSHTSKRAERRRIIIPFEKPPKQVDEHFIGHLYRPYSEKASAVLFWKASSA